MQAKISTVYVNDQTHALKFYTEVLGFVKKSEIPLSDGFVWLTVISPQGPDDFELLLEPTLNPVAKTFQEALYAQGTPLRQFASDNLQAEYERLTAHGVVFSQPPMDAGVVFTAVFDDTCGNLIMLVEVKPMG